MFGFGVGSRRPSSQCREDLWGLSSVRMRAWGLRYTGLYIVGVQALRWHTNQNIKKFQFRKRPSFW